MNVQSFMQSIKSLRSPHAFNPYTDVCATYDVADAASLRETCLNEILEQATNSEIDAIWVGRDLGHRGGRRTGLALTDDVHCSAHGARWNVAVPVTTKGPAFAERTAGTIWSVLERIEENIFLWNVFPLHPHLPGAPLSNRAHSSYERILGEAVLADLVCLLNPRQIVAIGKDASTSAVRCSGGRPVYAVRHPSYGGQREFLQGINDLYREQFTRTERKPHSFI